MKSLGVRILLALTSFAPTILAFAISYAMSECNSGIPSILVISFVVLLIACYFLIKYASDERKKLHTIQIKEFSRGDQGIVVFMFVWVIPFLRSSFITDWATCVYVFVVVLLCIVDAGAYNFNPIVRLFGYRFYTVKDHNNVQSLLIIRDKLTAPNVNVDVNKISDDVLIVRRNTDVSQIFHSRNYPAKTRDRT